MVRRCTRKLFEKIEEMKKAGLKVTGLPRHLGRTRTRGSVTPGPPCALSRPALSPCDLGGCEAVLSLRPGLHSSQVPTPKEQTGLHLVLAQDRGPCENLLPAHLSLSLERPAGAFPALPSPPIPLSEKAMEKNYPQVRIEKSLVTIIFPKQP